MEAATAEGLDPEVRPVKSVKSPKILKKRPTDMSIPQVRPVCLENERAAVSALTGIVEGSLETFSTSMEEDLAILEQVKTLSEAQ